MRDDAKHVVGHASRNAQQWASTGVSLPVLMRQTVVNDEAHLFASKLGGHHAQKSTTPRDGG